MSGILLLPGYMLTIVLDGKVGGIFPLIQFLSLIILIQIVIAIEFTTTNFEAYWSMAYNFERVFLKVESVNFQFMTEEMMHHPLFNKFLLFMQLITYATFLYFKWTTGARTMLNEKASKLIGTVGEILIFFVTFIPKSIIDWL